MIWASLLFLILVILVPASYKTRNSVVTNINQGLVVFDDFIEPSIKTSPLSYQGTNFIGVTSGAATVDQTVAYGNRNYPGAVVLAINVSGDNATLRTPSVITLKNSRLLDAQTRFFISGLITNTRHSFGFSDSLDDRSLEGDAAVIYYDKNISNNYICYAKTSDGNTTAQTITTVPAAISTDTYFRILVTPNFVYYYINAVLVATLGISINPPAHLACGWSSLATGAMTPVTVVTDAVMITQQFTQPRLFINPASQ